MPGYRWFKCCALSACPEPSLAAMQRSSGSTRTVGTHWVRVVNALSMQVSNQTKSPTPPCVDAVTCTASDEMPQMADASGGPRQLGHTAPCVGHPMLLRFLRSGSFRTLSSLSSDPELAAAFRAMLGRARSCLLQAGGPACLDALGARLALQLQVGVALATILSTGQHQGSRRSSPRRLTRCCVCCSPRPAASVSRQPCLCEQVS